MTKQFGCCADKACTLATCMALPADTTCGDCANFKHCATFYAHKADDTYCDFFPRRFKARQEAQQATTGEAA